MEIAMVKAFGWSLHDIDETDTEDLILFINRVNGGSSAGERRVYIDQIDL